MMCDRCGMQIRDGEEYTTIPMEGATAAGSDLHLHEPPCQRPPEVERPRTYPSQTTYRRH